MKKAYQQGFTLIEALAVLVMLSIALGLVVQNINFQLLNHQEHQFTNKLIATLRQSRSQAILFSTVKILSLNALEKKLESTDSNIEIPLSINLTLTGAAINTDSKPSIIFYPDGSSSGGSIKIKSTHYNRTINIEWLTGHIEVMHIDQ